MGTPEFAVSSLNALTKKHEVVAVISRPDKPKGRGKKLEPTPIKKLALEKNIPIFQPEKIKDENFIKILEKIQADLFVVVAYGQILSEQILKMPKLGCINVHGSLLPKYRGAAPIQWAIINGEDTTGVTIMYMDKGLDSGDMILKEEIKIDENETYGSLYEKMSIIGANTLINAIDLIQKNKNNRIKQDDSLKSFAPPITKDMGLINWNKTSKEIINLIRGLNPSPGAYTTYKNEVFKIWSAKEVFGYDGKTGEVVSSDSKTGLIIKTKDTAIYIKEIQQKGGKKMSSNDYLKGHKIEKNIILK